MNINIKNITHTYDVDVLHDISFILEGYKSVAIIGISGSGKSTLLRLMSGLERPTSGDIYIDGQNVLDPVYKKHIGFIFQHHNLFPHLSLEENITLVLEKTRGVDKLTAKETAHKYLSLLHLEDQVYKKPKNVSGGQAQRASIARALSVDPFTIFMDEPTASLDPILTFEVLSAVQELRVLGKNFVFVTHVLSFVRDFADYVIFMHEGNIAEHGTPDILDHPKNQAFKDFMMKVK
ncbi:MAG: ATP-binding cassette domain-containing protein [Firmicutes bacterium]|nr:ATP-binding cassette domain-containing protein [Bacillota bacterium]